MDTNILLWRNRLPAILVATTVLYGGAANAQDVLAGEQLAKTSCAGCHQVDKNDLPKRSDAIPSFVSVANMNSTTAMSLRVFLSTPHANMPDYSLSRNEISNVSAYILSLRTDRKP